MNDYLVSGCAGFLCGLASWFALFKIVAVFRMFHRGIEEAFRND